MDNLIIPLPATNGKHPIQTKPPYHCPHCQGPISRVLQYDTYRNPRAVWKPLDDLGEHLIYLQCPLCQIAHRAARLGDALIPFDWPPGIDGPGEARYLSALLQEIVQLVGPQGKPDLAASIVYRLLAGTLAPQAAIVEIRQLVEVTQCTA